MQWLLYTTEVIETPEQVARIVDIYRARWTIEEYFKAIKTGCGFEKKQLQDFEALTNLLATFAPIAYRLGLIALYYELEDLGFHYLHPTRNQTGRSPFTVTRLP